MSTETTTALAALVGPGASDELIEDFARAVLERAAHEHPKRGEGEDWFCNNLAGYMGERMHAVLIRLRDTEARLKQIRADERARCVAELRTYSDELMPAAADQVITGDDTNGFAAVRFASSMARASQLLESGELSTPLAGRGEAESNV